MSVIVRFFDQITEVASDLLVIIAAISVDQRRVEYPPATIYSSRTARYYNLTDC